VSAPQTAAEPAPALIVATSRVLQLMVNLKARSLPVMD
jgi:hypothetical protein